MSKPYRGKNIRDLVSHGRGVCPLCKKSGVKLLYEQDAGESKVKVCKICRASIKSGKKSLSTLSDTVPGSAQA